MKTNDAGKALIKEFEGLRLRAYKDIVGVLTIGYGCTTDVHEGMIITEKEADERLAADLFLFEQCVGNALDVEVTPNQFAAMVCLAYNVGCKAFSGSTLLKLLNGGNPLSAQAQFPRWNKAGGAVVAGLTRRREAESKLFGTK